MTYRAKLTLTNTHKESKEVCCIDGQYLLIHTSKCWLPARCDSTPLTLEEIRKMYVFVKTNKEETDKEASQDKLL